MISNIKLYDRHTIDQIEWPDNKEAQDAQALLLPMVKEGVHHYIRNVDTNLYLLQIDDTILPITANSREYNNSYITSNYFLIKHLEEILSEKHPRFYKLQKPFINGMGLFLKGIKINKVVIVNNWLLTNNIYPTLTEEQIESVTAFITHRFPDHLIVFRSLNTRKCIDLSSHLKKNHYRFVSARHVFIYDPEQKHKFASKVFYHHRRDRRLLKNEGYEVIRGEEIKSEEIPRLLELYNHTYLSRHTKYSPQYTEKFVQEAIEKGFFNLIALKKGGEIQGVMGCHERDGTMMIPFFGYDPNRGGPNHLYRLLTILAIDEAEKREMVLNDGSGGSAPKQYRGMEPFPEYVAFYDRHLPLYRRLFWGFAEKAAKWFESKKL